MGDVLAPALGGEPEDWGRANAQVFQAAFDDRVRWYDDDPEVAERNLIAALLRDECAIVGVPYPGDDEAFALGRRMDEYVCRRADCAFPAAVDVIRVLAASHELHTATGNPSWRVGSLLDQWGVRERFGVTPGTDLVGVMKDTAEFHRRVFALAGVDAVRAIVVDDSPEHLVRARAAGALGILVAPGGPAPCDAADAVVSGIAGVPEAVRRLG